jgi:hypothetical protein
MPYYSDNPISAAKEMAAEEVQAVKDDAAVLRGAGRIGVLRPEGQYERLGGEARLDQGCRSDWLPAWMLLGYGGQLRWEREAKYDELHRWCRMKLDRQTTANAETIRRKAARADTPLSLSANVGKYGTHPGESGFATATDQASFQAWQRQQYAAPERRWSDDQWAAFKASLTDPEIRTLTLLVDELHLRGTDRGAGRAVARILGCDEKTVRDRRTVAARKLWRAGIAYVIRGKTEHGPAWAARRQAPSGTPIRSGLADEQLEVRNAPISVGELIPFPPFFTYSKPNSVQGDRIVQHGNVKYLTPLRRLVNSGKLSLKMIEALTGIPYVKLKRACSGYTELDSEEMALVQRHIAIDRARWAVVAGRFGVEVEDELFKVRGDFANEVLDAVDELYERRERERLGTSHS